MSKQTALQWLSEQLNDKWINGYLSPISIKSLIDEALQMEREQIIDAYYEGKEYGFKEQGEQYYNETYGGQDE